MATQTASKPAPAKKPQPPPNSDFHEVVESLDAEEIALLKWVWTSMETDDDPIITESWAEDSLPFELLTALRELVVGGFWMQGSVPAASSENRLRRRRRSGQHRDRRRRRPEHEGTGP